MELFFLTSKLFLRLWLVLLIWLLNPIYIKHYQTILKYKYIKHIFLVKISNYILYFIFYIFLIFNFLRIVVPFYLSLSIWYTFNFTIIFSFEVLSFFFISMLTTIYFGKFIFLATLAAWLTLQTFGYLLLVGFVYFLKRNEYNADMPLLSRFWQRSFGVFWLLEGFLFLCFTYFLMNSSQELWCGKDTLGTFKTEYFVFGPWLTRLILICLPIISFWIASSSLDLYGYSNIVTTGATFFLAIVGLLEIITFYNLVQALSTNYFLNGVEVSRSSSEWRRSRIVHQFLLICSLAKFWHIVIVAVAWIIVIPALDSKKSGQLSILSLCSQNLVAIYGLTLLGTAPYFKYLFHTNFEHFAVVWSFQSPSSLLYSFFKVIRFIYVN